MYGYCYIKAMVIDISIDVYYVLIKCPIVIHCSVFVFFLQHDL